MSFGRLTILSTAFVLLAMRGCTMLVQWNPVLNGMELDKEVTFTLNGVSVTVSSFGFLNGHWGPQVRLKIEDRSRDTVAFNTGGFAVVCRSDSVRLPHPHFVAIRPKQAWDTSFSFAYSLTGGQAAGGELPRPASVEFDLPRLAIGDTLVDPPVIEYRDPHPGQAKE